jgi:hypothetical protein
VGHFQKYNANAAIDFSVLLSLIRDRKQQDLVQKVVNARGSLFIAYKGHEDEVIEVPIVFEGDFDCARVLEAYIRRAVLSPDASDSFSPKMLYLIDQTPPGTVPGIVESLSDYGDGCTSTFFESLRKTIEDSDDRPESPHDNNLNQKWISKVFPQHTRYQLVRLFVIYALKNGTYQDQPSLELRVAKEATTFELNKGEKIKLFDEFPFGRLLSAYSFHGGYRRPDWAETCMFFTDPYKETFRFGDLEFRTAVTADGWNAAQKYKNWRKARAHEKKLRELDGPWLAADARKENAREMALAKIASNDAFVDLNLRFDPLLIPKSLASYLELQGYL